MAVTSDAYVMDMAPYQVTPAMFNTMEMSAVFTARYWKDGVETNDLTQAVMELEDEI